ncbi:MAG: TonB-dependent receptor [Acidobacteria bacterium]|nr:TonB-dependent receptor [Acidobacteriota bacterium]
MRRVLWRAVFTLCAALPGAEHRGVVKSSALPIPGATVTATQESRRITVWSDEAGVFRFPDLAPGTWKIEVSMAGFEVVSRDIDAAAAKSEWNLVVKTAPQRTAPAPVQGAYQQLAVQQTLQSEVQAALAESAPLPNQAELQQSASESYLMSGSLSRGLPSAQQEDMLMAMREGFRQQFEGMLGAPGLSGFGGQQPAEGAPPMMGGRGPEGGGRPGAPMMGGMPGGGPMTGGPGMRGGAGPLGGRGSQGRPGAQKKGGAEGPLRDRFFGNRMRGARDLFRGGAFFTLRDSALDAAPYSLTGQPVTKPSYTQTRFGLTGGGTLHIPKLVTDDKTFFFVNYSGTRSRNPFDRYSTLPLGAERSGDFSATAVRGRVSVFDPLNGQLFPGNRIPLARQDGAARGLLEFFPQPNLPGTVRNYHIVTSNPRDTDNLSLRLNRSVTTRDRLAGSYSLQRRASESTELFGFSDTSRGRGQSLDLTWSHTFAPGFLSNLRASFSRNRSELLPFFAFQRDIAGELGILGVSRAPEDWGPPNLSFTNFGALSDGSRSLRRDQTLNLNQGFIRARGKHTRSFGFEYRRMQMNTLSHQNGRGTFTFSGLATSAFDRAGNPLDRTGLDFADFLLGRPQSSSVRFGSGDTHFRNQAFSAYTGDDWRARSRLTLSYGIRYEYNAPVREKYLRMANLDVAPGFTAVAVVTPGSRGPYSGAFPAGLIDPDRNNFSPRFGFAYKPVKGHSTQVRGGYGVYYNTSIYNQAASRMAQQPPFAKSSSVQTSLARPLSIRDGFTLTSTQDITNTFAVARDYRIGYAQTWTLALQQEAPGGLVVELGYLGTKGTRLDIQRLPNRAAPGSPLTAEDRRLIANATGFIYESSEGNSIYHAGQARVMRRFRQGFSANALYTWGRSIDNASTLGGGGAVVAQNDRDLAAERGLSSFDRRHTLNLFWMFSTGFGRRGRGGRFTNHVLIRNWSWSGGITARSGGPFTATVLGNRSDAGGTGAAGSSRADATGLPVTAADGYFNLLAFALPPAGQYGNAGRNTIPGPGAFSVNTSLGRTISLGEARRSLDIRAEADNVLNHVSISRIGTTVNSSNYGLATAAGNMRTISLSLRMRF